MTANRRPRPINCKSMSLKEDENEAVFGLLGDKCVTLATGVVQVYLADAGAKTRWNKRHVGVACLVKDNGKRSYYIRVFDIKKRAVLWDQEIYNQFKYNTPRPYFHTFEANNCVAGLNFTNDGDARQFAKVIEQKLLEKQQRKMEKKRQTAINVAPPSPRGAPLNSSSQSLSPANESDSKSNNSNTKKKEKEKKQAKKEKNKPKKLTKHDIGTPLDFRVVDHVGWDPINGFLMTEVTDPTMKTLFKSVGIEEGSQVDEATVDFIYDFVQQNGGVDALKKDIASRPPPPSTAPPKRAPTGPLPPVPQQNRGALPALPPTRGAAPPPPRTRGPSTPARMGAPPPPPPPPTRNLPPPPAVPSGHAPPPPPMAPHAPPMAPPPPPMVSAPPAPPMGGLLGEIHQGKALKTVTPNAPGQEEPRGDLLSQIRQGTRLKTVEAEESDSRAQQQEGIVGALALALANRQKQIQGYDDDEDDDDDDEEDEDDDDWDD